MKLLRTGVGLLMLVLLTLLVLQPLRAQDGGKPQDTPAPKKEKEKKPSLEDAIARAIRRAQHKVDNQKFMQATVLRGTLEDDEVYLVVCEYGTGDVAIFEGGLEPSGDQWCFFEKSQLTALEQILQRAQHR